MASATEVANGGELHLKNRLSESRSPYVRGHMDNPVAWQMWTPETLALAKKSNRLLFVSIGYAACHWCHVMERESFASPEIARLLNTSFIPIKIDREERPDIDAIYMNYVQATTGGGGWPLNVFLTPDLEPVFGGTYWPGPNHSMTAVHMGETVGFLEILEKVRDVWTMQEGRCRESAKEITRQLKEFAEEGMLSHGRPPGEKEDGGGLELELLDEAYQHFEGRYDEVNGGFSRAPKFPTPVNLEFLLRLGQWPQAVKDLVGEEGCATAASMAIHTLRKMARGGIRDQIGYGFARYSVTKDWSLPHFEKMLYDQAQLLSVYLDAFLITHDPEMLGAVYDIAAYLTSAPIAAPTGGFFSSEDADSYPTRTDTEKREGAYYVWTLKDFHTILGDRDADVCARFYGVTADGNVDSSNDPHDEFISQNVLSIQTTPSMLAKELGLAEEKVVTILKAGRTKLREYREMHRPRPALDDKIVVAWNGLAIGALARTSAALEEIDPAKAKECRDAAEKAVAFIKQELFDRDGHLWRVYRLGRGDAPGFADDYAFLIHGLLDLYEATFDDQYLQFADTLQKSQIHLFHDPTPTPNSNSEGNGFFSTLPRALSPDLLLRLKSGMDAAEPSPNHISALNLFRLASMLDHDSYGVLARGTVQAFEAEVEQHPFLFVGLLAGVGWGRLGVRGVVLVVGGEGDAEVGERGIGEVGNGKGEVKEAVRRLRGGVGVGRTVVKVGKGVGGWLRGRNELLRGLDVDVDVNGGREKVLVCEGGVCREGVELIS